MIPYILHVTVITTACFLFYKLFLQKETFYKLNRWTLLGCLAVSFTLPLLPVPGNWSWRESWTARSAQPVAPPVVERTEPGQKKIAMNEAEPTVSEPVPPVRPVKQRHQATRPRAMQRPNQHPSLKPPPPQTPALHTP